MANSTGLEPSANTHLRDECAQLGGEIGGFEGASPRAELPPSAGQPQSPSISDGFDNLIPTPSLGPAMKGSSKLARKDTAGNDAMDTNAGGASNRTASPATPAPTAIDPLSHHIFVRTNTDRSIPLRLRPLPKPDSPANEGTPSLPRASSDLTRQSTPYIEQGKEKKKGSSFLSRFSMISNKKKGDDMDDDESEISEMRTEGANAIAFSSAIGAGGYIPQHKEPPRYIKVKAHNKKTKEFNRIFLAQELVGTHHPVDGSAKMKKDTNVALVKPAHGFGRKNVDTGGPIWAVEFSRDGKYLATAGRDGVVRIWAVLATPEDRSAYEDEEKDACGGARLSAPVFHPKPVREFTGHTGEILDLSWSKNNFVLSSSMDKTVRLWHMSREECLCTFKHKDFVTSIAFHPRDDRFFLAGSLDSTLRLWSIPDKAVAYSSQLSDLITAVAFSPDGKTSIAGCLNGLCTFYDTEGLKFQTQIHVRSSRGKNAKGSKITGIQTMTCGPQKYSADGLELDDAARDVKVLVSSNDSRIRIYNLKTKELEIKFKGHENTCNQIRASFSDDGEYIVCGSEDCRAFIWSTGKALTLAEKDRQDKRPCESFEAHPGIVTQAVFAPTASRQLLQASEDPLFTLCNPPPVMLLSRDEVNASHIGLPKVEQLEPVAKARKPEHSPGFIERSKHLDGNILVTTDHTGSIKVFRQDCAFTKRRHETWETGSTFSKKLGRDGLLGRTGSINTKTSASSIRDPHSRGGSVKGAQQPSITGTPQMSSDRIISWRQGIEGNGHNGNVNGGSRPTSMTMTMTPPTRSERSASPAKVKTPAGANLASEQRRQLYANVTSSPMVGPTSPTSSCSKEAARNRLKKDDSWEKTKDRDAAKQPPTPSFSYGAVDDDGGCGADNDADVSRLDPAGSSNSFWNLNRWRGLGLGKNSQDSEKEKGPSKSKSEAQKGSSITEIEGIEDHDFAAKRKSPGHVTTSGALTPPESIEKTSLKADAARRKSSGDKGHHLNPPATCLSTGRPMQERQDSVASKLTMELESEEGPPSEVSVDEEMRCTRCAGRSFKAKFVGGKQRLLCARCGAMVDG